MKRISAQGTVWFIAFGAVCGCLHPADGAIPSFTVGPYLQSVTESSIIVCWESDVRSDGTVEYWVEGTQTSFIMNVERRQRHEVVVGDLQPGTAYGYRIRIPFWGEGSFFSGRFRTAPAKDAPLTFVVYGDTRGSGPEHRRVVEGIMAVNPAFVVHTGDLINCGDSDYYWNIFWETVAPTGGDKSLAGNSPLYPVVGNHEYFSQSGGYKDEAILKYQSYFVLPPNGLEAEHPEWSDRFYSFQYGPAFFIVLDTNRDSDPEYDAACGPKEGPPDIHPGSPQHEWLINQLEEARARCPFTFVCLHPSPYSSGPWGKTASYTLRFLDPLFREYGVEVVFSSHDHFYERCETYVDNYRLTYLVEGAGGAPIYQRSSGWDEPGSWMWDELNQTYYTKAFDNYSHSFIRVDIVPFGNGMWRATFSATRPDGEVFDVVEMKRLMLSFESVAGRTYQIQYSDELQGDEMEWQPLGEPIVAEGPFIRMTDDGRDTGIPPADEAVRRRFYRAFELP